MRANAMNTDEDVEMKTGEAIRMQAGGKGRGRGAWRAVVGLSLVLGVAYGAACGSSSPAPKTDEFLGPWTFTSGTLTPMCVGGISVPPFGITGLSVTFTKVDASTISLTAGSAGCTVKFKVSGDTATAEPKQICTLDVGGALMTQMIGVTTWTLKLSGADRLDSDIKGTAAICTVAGTGVLTRGAPDGGTSADGGGDGATDKGASDGATDTAAEAGATDGGTDAASEAGATDGGTDAASEAGATDGGTDAASEAGATDGGTDAASEAGATEAGTDAASEAGATEAGTDTGADVSSSDATAG